MRLLREHRREDLFIPVAKLQIEYLLTAADALAEEDAELAHEMRIGARGAAYNIASFTWPGWGDWPEPISEQRQALGLAAAKKGLEIAESLGDVTPNILWILGVHHLNAGQHDQAVASFNRAKQFARNEFYGNMHLAWVALTELCRANTQANLSAFETALTKLMGSSDEQASFFVQQLETARGIYVR